MAPSARRTANSPCLEATRVSNSCAAFRQATSSTKDADTAVTITIGRTGPTSSSLTETRERVNGRRVFAVAPPFFPAADLS